MSTLRRTAATATDLACRATGRRQVIRAARFVLRRACLDVPNDLRTNGESSLQRWTLDLWAPGREIHVIDVGANVGRWSVAMLAAAQDAARSADLDLHVFEPSAYTFERLVTTLTENKIHLHRMAVGDRTGSSLLHVVAPGAGTNSLYTPSGQAPGDCTEEVVITTLSSYADRAGLDQLALVKIDTEGHDCAVLRGARELFVAQRISVAQFEYNSRWIDARCYLRDVFELLEPLGYRVGKLTPAGVEFYPSWDAELETFVEGNYVVCRESLAAQLPSVKWWKLPEAGDKPIGRGES
jgi:FkbM family methyltransferase